MPYPDGARLDLPGGPEEPIDECAEHWQGSLEGLEIFIATLQHGHGLIDEEWEKLDTLVNDLYATLDKWKREVR